MKTNRPRFIKFSSIFGLIFTGVMLLIYPKINVEARLFPEILPTPTPTLDRLATPALSDHPSQEELGKNIYYYNCMPCHGDQGQGLTDEWREAWVEDHQNCWARGCHGGKERDEGFPIPTIIPAVILEGDALGRYSSIDDLIAYLKSTHPPQAPGRLSDDDYKTVALYLWIANHKSEVKPTDTPIPTATPSSDEKKTYPIEVCGISVSFIIGFAGAVVGLHVRNNRTCRR
jgi:mono/diheme cytochrome c family protein